jgi:ribonuclease D
MELARRKPSSQRELEQIRGAGAGNARRAQELLAAVERGRQRPPEAPTQDTRMPSPKPEDAPLIALSEALVRAHARDASIAYELIAARAELQAIVASRRTGEPEPDVRTLRGWRRELVGEKLLELLDGRVSLSVVDRQLRIAARSES